MTYNSEHYQLHKDEYNARQRKYKQNHREKVNSRQRKYHAANRVKYRKYSKTQYDKKRAWLSDYKKTHPCCQCGFSDYRALQFHHRDPSEKEFGINSKFHQMSTKKLMVEIQKCDILCANCHSIYHFDNGRV